MQWILQDMDIGHNLKMLRKKAGFTQDEVTAKMQVLGSIISRATYSKIETGKRNIKVSDLILLKQVLKAGYQELLEGDRAHGQSECE